MNFVIILKQVKRASLTCCFSFTGETALPQIWKQKNADSLFKRGGLPIYQTQDQAVSVECKDYYLRGEKDYLKLCYYYQEHLTLKSLGVTSFQFLLTISPLNQTLRSREQRIWSPTKEALDCWTNSLCRHLENIARTVWRIYILTSGCEGFSFIHSISWIPTKIK